jgi:hypothetical protein
VARIYTFAQVDVFTDRIFGGNSLAVFLEPEGLSDAKMQSIALEMNLSSDGIDEWSAWRVRRRARPGGAP